jgi:basic membrane lipoprotein Med (substrate-binding protein (PBP1-ABC) superfamily)
MNFAKTSAAPSTPTGHASLTRLKAPLIASLLALAATVAAAQPAVIYDMGGKFDKSFTQRRRALEKSQRQELP